MVNDRKTEEKRGKKEKKGQKIGENMGF